jgi:hypothetical protein
MKGGLRGWCRHCFSCLRPTNQAALRLAPELVHGHVIGEVDFTGVHLPAVRRRGCRCPIVAAMP